MSIMYTESYLAHHGILGQKWGVRRFQNEDGSLTAAGVKRYGTAGISDKTSKKEIRAERDHLINKYESSDPRKKERDRLEKEAMDLYDNHEFDGDDGGGGRTDEDRAAGKRYMELYDKINEIDSEIGKSAAEKASKELLEKYGSKKMNSINKGDTVKTGAMVTGVILASPILLPAAFIVAAAALPIGIIGGAIESAKDKKKQNKETKDS